MSGEIFPETPAQVRAQQAGSMARALLPSLVLMFAGQACVEDDGADGSDSGAEAGATGEELGTSTGATDTSGSGTGTSEGGETGMLEMMGEQVYRQPVDDGNSFTCATCHALTEPAADGLRRVGHPIGGAGLRPNFKNGQISTMLAAVNTCLNEWMNADPWTPADPRWLALEAFLATQPPTGEGALTHTIVVPAVDLAGGQADRGQALFNASCSSCHGQDGAGTTQGPPVVGQGQDPAYVARRVRTSGRKDSKIYPNLTGGVMPFWSAERLSDDELRDLVAYLALVDEDPDTSTGEEDSGSDDTTGTGEECEKTSARIGWTAELEDFFHGVAGTAEIIDDCTVEIRDFYYDGRGIDVRIYGAQGGDFDQGYSMSEDLLRMSAYEGETIYARLPPGRSMDELDGVSVWCVDVGVDFGSGSFQPPR